MQKAQHELPLPSHGSGDEFLHLPKLGLQREYRAGGGGWGGDACISGSSPQGEKEHQVTPRLAGQHSGRQVPDQEAAGTLFWFRTQAALWQQSRDLGGVKPQMAAWTDGEIQPRLLYLGHLGRAFCRGGGHPPMPVPLDDSPQSPCWDIEGTDHPQCVQNRTPAHPHLPWPVPFSPAP